MNLLKYYVITQKKNNYFYILDLNSFKIKIYYDFEIK